MKTIEERAKEYVGASCDDGCAICDASLCKLNEYSAFIAGAQSEHEELTRWHDPKEELPNDDHDVLVKTTDGDFAVDYYIHELGLFCLEDVHSAIKILGWREIHE